MEKVKNLIPLQEDQSYQQSGLLDTTLDTQSRINRTVDNSFQTYVEEAADVIFQRNDEPSSFAFYTNQSVTKSQTQALQEMDEQSKKVLFQWINKVQQYLEMKSNQPKMKIYVQLTYAINYQWISNCFQEMFDIVQQVVVNWNRYFITEYDLFQQILQGICPQMVRRLIWSAMILWKPERVRKAMTSCYMPYLQGDALIQYIILLEQILEIFRSVRSMDNMKHLVAVRNSRNLAFGQIPFSYSQQRDVEKTVLFIIPDLSRTFQFQQEQDISTWVPDMIVQYYVKQLQSYNLRPMVSRQDCLFIHYGHKMCVREDQYLAIRLAFKFGKGKIKPLRRRISFDEQVIIQQQTACGSYQPAPLTLGLETALAIELFQEGHFITVSPQGLKIRWNQLLPINDLTFEKTSRKQVSRITVIRKRHDLMTSLIQSKSKNKRRKGQPQQKCQKEMEDIVIRLLLGKQVLTRQAVAFIGPLEFIRKNCQKCNRLLKIVQLPVITPEELRTEQVGSPALIQQYQEGVKISLEAYIDAQKWYNRLYHMAPTYANKAPGHRIFLDAQDAAIFQQIIFLYRCFAFQANFSKFNPEQIISLEQQKYQSRLAVFLQELAQMQVSSLDIVYKIYGSPRKYQRVAMTRVFFTLKWLYRSAFRNNLDMMIYDRAIINLFCQGIGVNYSYCEQMIMFFANGVIEKSSPATYNLAFGLTNQQNPFERWIKNYQNAYASEDLDQLFVDADVSIVQVPAKISINIVRCQIVATYFTNWPVFQAMTVWQPSSDSFGLIEQEIKDQMLDIKYRSGKPIGSVYMPPKVNQRFEIDAYWLSKKQANKVKNYDVDYVTGYTASREKNEIHIGANQGNWSHKNSFSFNKSKQLNRVIEELYAKALLYEEKISDQVDPNQLLEKDPPLGSLVIAPSGSGKTFTSQTHTGLWDGDDMKDEGFTFPGGQWWKTDQKDIIEIKWANAVLRKIKKGFNVAVAPNEHLYQLLKSGKNKKIPVFLVLIKKRDLIKNVIRRHQLEPKRPQPSIDEVTRNYDHVFSDIIDVLGDRVIVLQRFSELPFLDRYYSKFVGYKPPVYKTSEQLREQGLSRREIKLRTEAYTQKVGQYLQQLQANATSDRSKAVEEFIKNFLSGEEFKPQNISEEQFLMQRESQFEQLREIVASGHEILRFYTHNKRQMERIQDMQNRIWENVQKHQQELTDEVDCHKLDDNSTMKLIFPENCGFKYCEAYMYKLFWDFVRVPLTQQQIQTLKQISNFRQLKVVMKEVYGPEANALLRDQILIYERAEYLFGFQTGKPDYVELTKDLLKDVKYQDNGTGYEYYMKQPDIMKYVIQPKVGLIVSDEQFFAQLQSPVGMMTSGSASSRLDCLAGLFGSVTKTDVWKQMCKHVYMMLMLFQKIELTNDKREPAKVRQFFNSNLSAFVMERLFQKMINTYYNTDSFVADTQATTRNGFDEMVLDQIANFYPNLISVGLDMSQFDRRVTEDAQLAVKITLLRNMLYSPVFGKQSVLKQRFILSMTKLQEEYYFQGLLGVFGRFIKSENMLRSGIPTTQQMGSWINQLNAAIATKCAFGILPKYSQYQGDDALFLLNTHAVMAVIQEDVNKDMLVESKRLGGAPNLRFQEERVAWHMSNKLVEVYRDYPILQKPSPDKSESTDPSGFLSKLYSSGLGGRGQYGSLYDSYYKTAANTHFTQPLKAKRSKITSQFLSLVQHKPWSNASTPDGCFGFLLNALQLYCRYAGDFNVLKQIVKMSKHRSVRQHGPQFLEAVLFYPARSTMYYFQSEVTTYLQQISVTRYSSLDFHESKECGFQKEIIRDPKQLMKSYNKDELKLKAFNIDEVLMQNPVVASYLRQLSAIIATDLVDILTRPQTRTLFMPLPFYNNLEIAVQRARKKTKKGRIGNYNQAQQFITAYNRWVFATNERYNTKYLPLRGDLTINQVEFMVLGEAPVELSGMAQFDTGLQSEMSQSEQLYNSELNSKNRYGKLPFNAHKKLLGLISELAFSNPKFIIEIIQIIMCGVSIKMP